MVQEDAIEERVEEEAVLSLTLPQEPHFKDAATEGVAKEGNKRQEKRKPCRAKAYVDLMFDVMHVHGEDPETPTEDWAVACSEKKHPQKQKAFATCERGEGAAACGGAGRACCTQEGKRLIHAGTLGKHRRKHRTVLEPRGSKRCWTPRWPWRLTSGPASFGRAAPFSSRCTTNSRECV